MHQRVRRGLARSFQITSVLPGFSALENVALAVQARARLELPLLRRCRERSGAERAGARNPRPRRLAGRARCARRPPVARREAPARARHRAGDEPKLLLLDEPLAGTGHEESERVVETLRGLKGRYTIVLIEHDMDAVFSLADRVSVLVYGRMIATDTPARDPRQRRGARRLSRRGGGLMLRGRHAERDISRRATAPRRCCSTSRSRSARARS